MDKVVSFLMLVAFVPVYAAWFLFKIWPAVLLTTGALVVYLVMLRRYTLRRYRGRRPFSPAGRLGRHSPHPRPH